MSDQSEAKRHKRGDVREDGMRFWQYIKGREYWVNQEVFEKRKQQMRDSDAKRKDKKKEYMQRWREANPEKAKAVALKSREKRRQSLAASSKIWRQNNPEKVVEMRKRWLKENRKKAAEAQRRWRNENRDRTRKWRREYVRDRVKKDALFALSLNLRARTYNAFSRLKCIRQKGFAKILGCTLEIAKAHLESKFQPGMSWENRSEWHIDHIVPLASAKTAEELIPLCHYTNLQPLWAKDNRTKGAKMPIETRDTQI